MKEIAIIAIMIGLGIFCIGCIVLGYTIFHKEKINFNSKFKYVIIILHWIVMIFGGWLIMESINIISFGISLLHTILTI